MTSLKLLVLIISDDSNETYKRNRDVWRKYMHIHKSVDSYFITLNDIPGKNYPYIENDTLYLNGKESFENIIYKTIKALEFFNKKGYDYVIRTNLSSIWNYFELYKFIQTLPISGVYCGVVGCDNKQPFVSGAGIIISKDVAETILQVRNEIYNVKILDDVALGTVLLKLNIVITPANRVDFGSISEYDKSRIRGAYHIRLKCHNRCEEAELMNMVYSDVYGRMSFRTDGRLVNKFILNMALNMMAKKYNFKADYMIEGEFKRLGISFFQGERNVLPGMRKIQLRDEEIYQYMKGEVIPDIYFDIENKQAYAQTKDMALYIRDYISHDDCKNAIIAANKHSNRYGNNNDVCIHVRLGDVPHFNPGFEYYDTVLSKLQFSCGYICSDSIDHDICRSLIEKYNLKPLIMDEIETIQFASTCKYLVMSNGTFSWLIGVMGFYSTVYYPKIKKVWHGDIFVFQDWNEIDGDLVLSTTRSPSISTLSDQPIKISFISYADDSFKKSRVRIVNEAKATGIFDFIKCYSTSDLEPDFIERNKRLLSQKRGGGYWCWKPYVVLKTLFTVPENSWVLYADAGCTLIQDRKNQVIERIIEMDRHGKEISAYKMPTLLEKEWTKKDMFIFFGVEGNDEIINTGQYIACVFMVKNTLFTRSLFEQCVDIISNNNELIDDSPSVQPNYLEFKEHRHDQSLLSIIRKLNNERVYIIPNDETYYGNDFVQAMRIKC